ncbi:MAG: adenylyl-sulfate kinase [Lapillicoccus sp.]
MAPVTRHAVVDGRSLADLELALVGVDLPWSVLGGDLTRPKTPRLAVELPGAVVDGLPSGGTLVLTDPTSLPVARLESVLVSAPDDGRGAGGDARTSLVEGDLVTVGAGAAAPPPGASAVWAPPVWAPPVWASAAGGVLVAQRPFLAGELAALLLPGAAAPDAGPVLRVLVPTGPTPDGIPGLVLLDAIRSTAAAHPGVDVTTVPVHWRGGEADDALLTAVTDQVRAPTSLLAADDAAWAAVRGEVLDGCVPAALDAAAEPALSAWRPPVGHRGVVVFFTGFSGSGKSSLADALVAHVRTHTRRTITLLDGDVVRTMLSSGLGFDRAGRDLNIRRIGYVAAEIARHHGMAVCAPIAPFAETRAAVRAMVEQVGDFVLIHVSTPIEECERRDRKGLYARARTGEIPDFTGISSPYDTPTDADLVVDTTGRTLEESLDEVLTFLRTTGWISA